MFEPAMARHFSAEVPYLADILAGHERWRPGQPALVCGNQRLTWQHLGRVSNQVAHGLLGHGLPAANAAATWRDDRGRAWLRTGDLGRVDDEGFLSIVGRKKGHDHIRRAERLPK